MSRAAPPAAAYREMVVTTPADAFARRQALPLLFCALPERERERRLAELYEAIERAKVSLDMLLVAEIDNRPAGALLAVMRPGRMAFFWPPSVVPAFDNRPVAAELLGSLAARLDSAGILFAQCLLDEDDAISGQALTAGGFPRCTTMLWLTRSAGRHVTLATCDDGPLARIEYGAETHARFARTLEETYRGTLDCPVLADIRSGDDALAAHRGEPPCCTSGWHLWHDGRRDAAVLLIVDHADRKAREIMYLGVVPAARGRGLGRKLLALAIASARAAGCDTLEVAVDAANHYALDVYRDLGFVESRRFAVHLRVTDAHRRPL